MNCKNYIYWCSLDAHLVHASELQRLSRWEDTLATTGSLIDWFVVPLGFTFRRTLDQSKSDGDIVFFENEQFDHVGVLVLEKEKGEWIVRHLVSASGQGWKTINVRHDPLDVVTAAYRYTTYTPFALAWKTLRMHLNYCNRDSTNVLTSDAFWALFNIPTGRKWL